MLEGVLSVFGRPCRLAGATQFHLFSWPEYRNSRETLRSIMHILDQLILIDGVNQIHSPFFNHSSVNQKNNSNCSSVMKLLQIVLFMTMRPPDLAIVSRFEYPS
jgi:hypothetical protein